MSESFRDLPSSFDWSRATFTHRKYLPHLFQTNVIYFITFRLNDSLPENRRLELLSQREAWLKRNPPPHTPNQEKEFREIWTARIENLLDSGHGISVFRNPRCREILEEILRYDDSQTYQLGDFVIMPNHVHLLLRLADGLELSPVLQTWKSISSRKINREIRRKGPLWMPESFDHIVRDEGHLNKFINYIKSNPKSLDPIHYTLSRGTLLQPK